MIQNVLLASLNGETANGTKMTRAKLTTTTTPKFPKYLGLGLVEKTYTQIVEFGKGYYDRIDDRLEVRGINASVEHEGLPWGNWLVYPFFIECKGKTYLRTYQVERCISNNVTYMVNGHEATKEELETIKAYNAKKAKPVSQKQADAGLNKFVQVKVLCYPLDSIDRIEFESGLTLVKG